MLPTKIIMSAFGSYPNETTVDMSQLGKSGVYLITGETGAGKSTIFDAIMFALYGKASGSKNKQSLRSQYADPDRKTFVDLYFEHKNTNYRIKRELYYAKKDYSAVPTTTTKLFTVDENGAQTQLNTNTVISGNKVSVEDILGLDDKQFKQVAMLAQGDFFNLVEDKSGTRKDIFTKIFDTRLYGEAEKLIKEDSRRAQEAVKEISSEIRTRIATLSENENHLGEISEILGDGVITPQVVADISALTEKIISEDSAAEKALNEESKTIDGRISEKSKLIENAERAEKIKAELNRKRELGNTLSAKKETVSAQLEAALLNEDKIKEYNEAAAIEEKSLSKYSELSAKTNELNSHSRRLSENELRLKAARDSLGDIEAKKAENSALLSSLANVDTEKHKAQTAVEAAEKLTKNIALLEESLGKLISSRKAQVNSQNDFISAENKALDSQREYIVAVQDSAAVYSRKIAESKELSDKYTAELQSLKNELDSIDEAEDEFGEYKSQLRENEHNIFQVNKIYPHRFAELDDMQNYTAKCHEQLQTATVRLDLALERVKTNNHLLDLNAVWKIAASMLTEDTPCPVCGSTHHPKPALKPSAVPTEEEITAAQNEYTQANEAFTALTKDYTALNSRYNSMNEALLRDCVQILGEAEYTDLKTAVGERLSELKAQKEKINTKLNKIRIQVMRKTEIRIRQGDIEKAMQKLSASQESLIKLHGESAATLQSALESFKKYTAEITSRCAQIGILEEDADFDTHIPTDISDGALTVTPEVTAAKKNSANDSLRYSSAALAAADTARRQFDDRRTAFNEQYKAQFGEDISGMTGKMLSESIVKEKISAQEKLNSAKAELKSAAENTALRDRTALEKENIEKAEKNTTENIHSLEKEISVCRANIENCRKSIDELTSTLEYKDEAEARNHITALRSRSAEYKAAIDTAKSALDRTVSELSTLSGTLTQLTRQLSELNADETDVASERNELEKLTADRATLDKRKIAVGTRLKGNTANLEKINKAEENRLSAQKKADTLDLLSRTANGTVQGKERLSLETFVQLHYFDRVIAHANERLSIMSNGQYELVRRKSAANLRSTFGLDLSIIDYYCIDPEKRTRDVTSISGGEKFKVALSLALGLSDEISNRAGVIRFDTLFVDEGFGSLDGESLQLALEVLNRLSTSDNRLIGIISHVEGLTNSIGKQIIVTKNGSRGSSIKIQK